MTHTHVGVATMSSCCYAPRQVNVHRLKRMYGYLRCNRSRDTRFSLKITNLESLETPVQ
jgi:hypothetical protein